MSYVMHTKRLHCLDFMKRFLKEKQKVPTEEMKIEIMKRFNFSGVTAERYIDDIILMGIAYCNSENIVYDDGGGNGNRRRES